MLILLLEKEPEIKQHYLQYLKRQKNTIVTEGDSYEESEVDVIIVRSNVDVDAGLLDAYKNLKYVCRVGVGLDKISRDECKERGIQICNTPGANAHSVADLVVLGILNLSRKIYNELYGLENRFLYMGRELRTRTAGIVGFGNIGKKVYERLKGFGVTQFVIYDPFLKKEDVESFEYCDYVTDKKDIFKKCDIITFHIPLLDSTRNFLGKKEFELISHDTLIMNTSRGGIINEAKLIEFLSKNPEAGALLDVWEEEPSDPKIELLQLKNCMVTPHIGAMTKEAEMKMHYFKELDMLKNRNEVSS